MSLMTLDFSTNENFNERVITKERLHLLENLLKSAKFIAIDIEGDETELYGIGFAFYLGSKLEKFFIPTKFTNKRVRIDQLREFFKAIGPKRWVGHNIKYDYKVLKSFGIDIGKNLDDTSIMAWVLDPNYHSLKLKVLGKEILGYENLREFPQIQYWNVNELSEYCMLDCEMTLQLYFRFRRLLEQDKQLFGIYNLERSIIWYVAEMERRGVVISRKKLSEIERVCINQMEKLIEEIKAITGRVINPNSTLQVRSVLPREILAKLPSGTSGVSTSKTALEMFSDDILVSKILEYRSISTIYDTFVKKLLSFPSQRLDDDLFIIYPQFRQNGTESGRFSSQNPNCQNIPAKGKLGHLIRQSFVARPGHLVVVTDISQLELMITAMMSKDPNMMRIYLNNGDLHDEVAKSLGVDRRTAKTINFGIIYGMSALSLAKKLRISENEADKLLKSFYKQFPDILKYKEKVKKQLIKTKSVRTYFGRRRIFKDVEFLNFKTSKEMVVFREAFNFTIQGTGADIVKIWTSNLANNYPEIPPATLQVHDELIIEVPKEVAEEYQRHIVEAFEKERHLSKLPLKLKVESKIANSWGDAKD